MGLPDYGLKYLHTPGVSSVINNNTENMLTNFNSSLLPPVVPSPIAQNNADLRMESPVIRNTREVFNSHNGVRYASPSMAISEKPCQPRSTVPAYNTSNPLYRNRFSADPPNRHYSQEASPTMESGYSSPTIFQRGQALQTFTNYQSCAPSTGRTYEHNLKNTPHYNCYSKPSREDLPMKLPIRVAPATNTTSKTATSFNVPSAQISEVEPINMTDYVDETERLENTLKMYVFETKRVLKEYQFQYLHPSFYRCLSCVNTFVTNSFTSFHAHVWVHIKTDFKTGGPFSHFTLSTEMKYYIDGYIQKMMQSSLLNNATVSLKLQTELDKNLCKLCALFDMTKGSGDVTVSKRVNQAIVQVSGKPLDVSHPSMRNVLLDFTSDNDTRSLHYKCTFTPRKEGNIVHCDLCSESFPLFPWTLELHAHNRHFRQTVNDVNAFINVLKHFASRLDKLSRGNVHTIFAEIKITFGKQIVGQSALSFYQIFADASVKKPVIISSYISEVTTPLVGPRIINHHDNYMNTVPSGSNRLNNALPEFHAVLSPCREIEQYGTRLTNDTMAGFYKCGVDCCSYSSILPDELVKHMRGIHNGITTFPCFLCRKVFDHYSLCLHLVHDHINVKNNSHHELFRCSEDNCEFHTDLLDQYIRHNNEVHSSFGTFRCFNCSREFSSIYLLENHFLKYLQKIVSCSYCSGRSFSHSCILNHIFASHKNRTASVSVIPFLSCSRLPTTDYSPLATTDNSITTLHSETVLSTNISGTTLSEKEHNSSLQHRSPSGSNPHIHNENVLNSSLDVCIKRVEQPSSERGLAALSGTLLLQDRLESNVEPASQTSETATTSPTQIELMVASTSKDSDIHEVISESATRPLTVAKNDALALSGQPSTDVQGSSSIVDTSKVAVVGKSAADTIPEHFCPLGSDELHDALETFMRTSPISSDITCKKCGHCFNGGMETRSSKRTIHIHILEHLKIYVHKCQLCSFKCVECNRIFVHLEKRHNYSRSMQNRMIYTSVPNLLHTLANAPNKDPIDRHEVSTTVGEKLVEEQKKIDESIPSNIFSSSSNKGLLSGKLFCFRCTLCNDFTAPSRDAVIAHITEAKHSNVIGCGHCKFRSTDLEEIKQHCQDVHKENLSFFYPPSHAHVHEIIYQIGPEVNNKDKERTGPMSEDRNCTCPTSENNVCPDHNVIDTHTSNSGYITDTLSVNHREVTKTMLANSGRFNETFTEPLSTNEGNVSGFLLENDCSSHSTIMSANKGQPDEAVAKGILSRKASEKQQKPTENVSTEFVELANTDSLNRKVSVNGTVWPDTMVTKSKNSLKSVSVNEKSETDTGIVPMNDAHLRETLSRSQDRAKEVVSANDHSLTDIGSFLETVSKKVSTNNGCITMTMSKTDHTIGTGPVKRPSISNAVSSEHDSCKHTASTDIDGNTEEVLTPKDNVTNRGSSTALDHITDRALSVSDCTTNETDSVDDDLTIEIISIDHMTDRALSVSDCTTEETDLVVDDDITMDIVYIDEDSITQLDPTNANTTTDRRSPINDGGEKNSLVKNFIDANLTSDSGTKSDENKESCSVINTLNVVPNRNHSADLIEQKLNGSCNYDSDTNKSCCSTFFSPEVRASSDCVSGDDGQYENDNSSVNQTKGQQIGERNQMKLAPKLKIIDKTLCNLSTLTDEKRSADGRIVLKSNLRKTKHSDGLSDTDEPVSKCVEEPSGKEHQDSNRPENRRKAGTTVHGNTKFKCIFCTRPAFTSKKELNSHVGKHFNYRPYQCGICKGTWIHENRAKKHHMAKHQGQDMDIISTVDDEIVASIELVTEYNEKGTPRRFPGWKCEQCNFSCHDISILQKHVEKNHSQPCTEFSTTIPNTTADMETDINRGACSTVEKAVDIVSSDTSVPAAIKEREGAEPLETTSISGSSVCFCCHLCSFKTRKLDDFQTHILYGCDTNEHLNGEVDECNPPNCVEDHPLTDGGIENVVSSKCSNNVSYSGNKESESTVSRVDKLYKCPFCPVYLTRDDLVLHVVGLHNDGTEDVCESFRKTSNASVNATKKANKSVKMPSNDRKNASDDDDDVEIIDLTLDSDITWKQIMSISDKTTAHASPHKVSSLPNNQVFHQSGLPTSKKRSREMDACKKKGRDMLKRHDDSCEGENGVMKKRLCLEKHRIQWYFIQEDFDDDVIVDVYFQDGVQLKSSIKDFISVDDNLDNDYLLTSSIPCDSSDDRHNYDRVARWRMERHLEDIADDISGYAAEDRKMKAHFASIAEYIHR